ncbi:aldo/keto reductase [Kribbella sp. NPDC059898]|uniref:aldo/keto reductase n=1 Tax=Kribbella sp. NPDC059898 TaxID=3346995 RepID=UPI00365DA39D
MAVPSQVLAPRSTVRFRPPRFGLGGSQLGWPDEETALATVDAAYQAGIRFFDTSPAYGESERRVGTALRRRPRGEFLVSTRVVGEDPEESIRKSSQTLGLTIDLAFLQQDTQGARRGDTQGVGRGGAEAAGRGGVRGAGGGGVQAGGVPGVQPGGVQGVGGGVEAGGVQGVGGGGVREVGGGRGVRWEGFEGLGRVRREGVVRAVGVVGGEWGELERVVREVELDCVLLTGQYSLLDQQAEPLLDTCLARGVSVIVAGALVLEPETVQARRISAVCERYGVSLPQAALAFPSRHPAVTSVLITAASPAEIRADAALVRQPVPERLWKDPELIGLLSSE